MVELHIFSCIFYFLLNHKTFTAVLYLFVTEYCISELFYAMVDLTPLQGISSLEGSVVFANIIAGGVHDQ